MMDRLRAIFKGSIEKNVGAGETGWDESQLYGGPFPKYNPDELIGRKSYKIYRTMMVDEQVKAVVRFKRDAITSRDIMFVMPNEDSSKPGNESDDRIRIYEDMVRQTYGSFVDGMNYVLMAMYQGFSMTEKLIDIFEHKGKPYLGVKALIPKPFETFEFNVDQYGAITSIIQEMDGRRQVIDLERFVYYVQNPEFDRHYGQSDLREAYRSWYAKDIIIRFYNQFLERFAGGFAKATPKNGQTILAGSADYNAIMSVMNGLQNKSSVLLPSNIDLEIEQPATTDQFEKAISMHDLQISKALLVPNLLGITPQAGTSGGFAQANTQLEAFLWTLDADASRLEEALNEQIFKPLNELNFADGNGPLMKFKAISDTKKMELIKTWKELVTAGAVEASDTDEHHLRELIDFPEKGEPLELEPEIGLPTEVPPQSRTRGPVKEPNQNRKKMSFSRATKRVGFEVIKTKADKIESEAVIKIESKLADITADLVVTLKKDKWDESALKKVGGMDFNPKLKSKGKAAIFGILKDAWDLGTHHAKTELNLAKKEVFKVNMARIDDAASDFIKLNSFRAFGLFSDDMRNIVQDILVNGIKFSWTNDEIVNEIYDSLTVAGFLDLATNSSATGRKTLPDAVVDTVSMHRLKTAVRTNVFEALNEARFSVFTDPELDGFVEAFEYSAILDSRTTAICRHLDDRVYPVDAPEWDSYRPPNHFNCRSILVPVTVIDEEVVGKQKAPGSRYSQKPTQKPQKGFGGR